MYRLEQNGIVDLSYSGLPTLFLDIDGVLNHSGSDRGTVCESNLRAFGYILEEVEDIVIVLSSSWRYSRTLDMCKELINDYFGMSRAVVVGRTPIYFSDEKIPRESRGIEIQSIVEQLKPSKFVILDDWVNFLEGQKPYHVQPSTWEGLTMDQAQQVVEIFKSV